MWQHVGVYPAAALFETSNRYVNDVAAIPSLHAAYTLLVVLFFWSRVPLWARLLLLLYPLAMGFTLVYTGEHYIFDVALGWVYAVAVYSAVMAFERRRESGRERAEEPGAAAATGLALRGSRVRV